MIGEGFKLDYDPEDVRRAVEAWTEQAYFAPEGFKASSYYYWMQRIKGKACLSAVYQRLPDGY